MAREHGGEDRHSVDKRDMQQVKEHGYPSKDRDLGGKAVERLLRVSKEKESRSQGRQCVEQGGRVFCDIYKGEEGKERVLLRGPGGGVSVQVWPAEEDKKYDG